jgi:hypothetical protein
MCDPDHKVKLKNSKRGKIKKKMEWIIIVVLFIRVNMYNVGIMFYCFEF